ncbi:MAG: ACP S-malonyltransferase, partial [Gammaproteobacteria bacterium]|nr:ACP S-malonyltransferase [Gammaproteobacteria bacterium]
MTLAMVFPGQGSQSPGMQADLAEHFDEVQQTYQEASDILGFDLWDVVQNSPAEKLAETTITQPAMLAAGVAAYRAWEKSGGAAVSQMAGHSLGEYTALVCAGAVDFTDAMRLVKRRSELMQAAVPVGIGAMAAVLGLDDDKIMDLCEEASTIGVAEPVNFNSPGQVVIAGHAQAVSQAVEYAKEHGARRAIILPVSVPSHSSLMREAGASLAESLDATKFRTPSVSVVSAATAVPYVDADDIRSKLSAQVYSPVLWVRTVQAMIDAGAQRIVECGPGKVLAGLIRRIDKSTPVAFIDNFDSLQKALQT